MSRGTWIKIGLSGLLVASAIAIIVYTANRSSGLFRFVDEVKAEAASLGRRDLWMAGTLEPNSHEVLAARGERPRHRFTLSHKGATIRVAYTGSMPQNVRPGRQLVVRGRLDGPDQFLAEEIRTTCPSKYKAEYEARK